MYLHDPNITKKGLLALKDSKPIAITAHTGEIIVPCIYTETVKKIMKSKGIHLPLSHHQLAEAKRLAHTIPGHHVVDEEDEDSHARGSKNLGKKRSKKKPKKAKTSKKVAEIPRPTHAPGIPGQAVMAWPSPAQQMFQQLPSTWQNFRPLSTQTPQVFTQRDFGEEAKKAMEEERKAVDKYKKEIEQRKDQLEEQRKLQVKWEEEHKPLRQPDQPIRKDDFDSISAPVRPSSVVIEEEEPSRPASPAPVHPEAKEKEAKAKQKAQREAEERAEEIQKASSKHESLKKVPIKDWLGQMTMPSLVEVARKLNRKLQHLGMDDMIIPSINKMKRADLMTTMLFDLYAELLEDIKNE